MVKIYLAAVGKLKERFWKEAAAEYEKRLSRFCKLEIAELPERRSLREEGEALLRIKKGYSIALAVEGKSCSSIAFAEKLKTLCGRGTEITFFIGSSEGLDGGVKRAADELMSFSALTFPHQMMRVILLEQIYRAFMINAGAEYHK